MCSPSEPCGYIHVIPFSNKNPTGQTFTKLKTITFPALLLFYFSVCMCVCVCVCVCYIGLDKGGYPVTISLISPQERMLWVLIRSASARRF